MNSVSFSHHPYMSSVSMRKVLRLFQALSFLFSLHPSLGFKSRGIERARSITLSSNCKYSHLNFWTHYFLCCETEQASSYYSFLYIYISLSIYPSGQGCFFHISLQHIWCLVDGRQLTNIKVNKWMSWLLEIWKTIMLNKWKNFKTFRKGHCIFLFHPSI